MSPEQIVFIASIVLVTFFVAGVVFSKIPRRLKHDKFYDKWKTVQSYCKDQNEWRRAVIEADNMLTLALKKRKIKGTNTGERMVSAQKLFTNNDAVWYGHKLRSKVEADPEMKLTQDEVKKALMGIGQGLKDIGALK